MQCHWQIYSEEKEMKIKKGTILIFILMASMILSSCGLFAQTGKNLMAGVEAAQWPDNPGKPSPAFIKAVSQFSWDLADVIDKKDGNLMISPASVYLALAMTMNGAGGQTRIDMLKALASQNLTMADIDKAARDWMILLNRKDEKNKLGIVNSIWYRKGFAADKSFLQSNADFYKAEIQSLDFSDAKSPDVINRWVEKSTEGRIDKIVDSIGRDTVMYLINAIYFKAEWLNKFTSSDTQDGLFKSPYGSTPAEFMNMTENMDYIEIQGAQGVVLPYSDKKFAFVALLPNEGTDPASLIHSLDAEKMNEMMTKKQSKDIALQLPKFEAEYKVFLKDALSGLGMGIAFDPGTADFSLMQESRKKDLCIAEVLHKTFIRVDEDGTEAAAVTKVEVSRTSAPVSKIAMVFDRPFLYCIIDLDTNLPLFIGIVEKP